jgi:hypothetical protein
MNIDDALVPINTYRSLPTFCPYSLCSSAIAAKRLIDLWIHQRIPK